MDTHWRNSMKPVRFFFMDARAAWPVLFMLLHLRWYTMVMTVITSMIFYLLEQRGLSFVAALRAFRVWLVTRKRPNIRHSNRHRMVDFGFEPLPERFLNEELPPDEKEAAKKAATARESAKGAAGAAKTVAPKKASAATPAPAAALAKN